MVNRTGRYSLPHPSTGESVSPASRDFVDLANAVDVGLGQIADQGNPVMLYGTEDPKDLPSEPRYFEVRAASVATKLGMPTSSTGMLEQWTVGTITLQKWTSTEGERQVWLRSRRAPADWSAWDLTSPYKPSPEAAGATGTKTVPLALSLPAATATQTAATGAARWVRRWAYSPSRVRLHVSNRNPANIVNGGAANLVGAKIGVAQSDGSMSDLADALPAGPIPTDGTELISQWMDCPGEDGDGFGVTLAWTGGSTQQVLDSGGWTRADTTGWDGETVTGWTRKVAMPFYVWIEAEVPARVPTVAGLGDSITVGRATTDPVQDSWFAVYALSRGALPVFFAQSGSSMSHWGITDARWTSYYPDLSFTPDVLMHALGQNNMLAGQTLEQHQIRFNNVRAAYSTFWPYTPVYLCGVTPSSGKPGEIRTVRRAFNEWLQTFPNGQRGYFDFPAAVGDANDEALLPQYAGDNLHPNTAGHAALAELLKARPVTPEVGSVSSWGDLADKPETFPPSAHTHAIADVSGLEARLPALIPEDLGTRHLDTVTSPGEYTQIFASRATKAQGYPHEARAGILEIKVWNAATGNMIAIYTPWQADAMAKRTYYNGAWQAWRGVDGAVIA